MYTRLLHEVDAPFHDLPTLPADVPFAALPVATEALSLARPDLRGVERLTALRTLQLPSGDLDADSLAALRGHPSVEHLSLSLTRAPGDGLAATLASLPSLRVLHVTAPQGADGDTVAAIAALPRLAALTLDCEGKLDDAALARVTVARSLRTLRVRRLARVSAKGLGALAALPLLEVLDLDRPSAADSDALTTLPGLAGLRGLRLQAVRVADEGHAPLASMTSLESLSLHNSPASGKVAPYVAALTGLRALDLGWSNVEGKHVAALASLTKLEGIDISNAKVSGPLLASLLGAMPLRALRACNMTFGPWAQALFARGELEALELNSGTVSRARLQSLVHLPRLRRLGLSSTKKLPAAALRALGRFEALESVELGHIELDDAALAALAGLPRLAELAMAYARGVTDAGLRSLARAKALRRLDAQGVDALTPETALAIAAATPLEDLCAWRCIAVRADAVARLRALRPTLSVRVEAWQRDPSPLPRAARVNEVDHHTVLAPDLRSAVSFDWSRSLVWDLSDGSSREGPKPASVHAAVFRACGTLFATGSTGAVTVYALPSGDEVFRTTAPPGVLEGAAATRDGARVAVVGDKVAEVWSAPAGERLMQATLPWRARGACFTPDGGALVVYGDGVAVLDVPSGDLRVLASEAAWFARAFDRDALWVVTAARALEERSFADGSLRSSWQQPPRELRRQLAVGPEAITRRDEPVAEYQEPDRVVHMARTRRGEVRVLLDRNGYYGELWAAGEATHLYFDASGRRPDLTDDGEALLVPVEIGAKANDRYDVDALLAYARGAR